MIRLALIESEVPYVTIAPATLKKYATGKGNATKADMRMAWFQRTGEDVRDDDAVDALWLRQIGPALRRCPRGDRAPESPPRRTGEVTAMTCTHPTVHDGHPATCGLHAPYVGRDEDGAWHPACQRHRGHTLPALMHNAAEVADIGIGGMERLLAVMAA